MFIKNLIVNKTLLLGVFFLISGIIITFFLVFYFLKINETLIKIQEESEKMLIVKRNIIYSTSLIAGALILAGFYFIKRAFLKPSKKKKILLKYMEGK
jgi:uncharacterized membrane protein YqhA